MSEYAPQILLPRLPGLLHQAPPGPDPGALPPGYRYAAVLVPLLVRNECIDVVLTRRTEHLRAHPGQISFPGGRMERGDRDLRDTALREANEELGIRADQVEVLGFLGHCDTGTGFRIVPMVGRLPPDCTLRPEPNEVAEILEVPLRRLLDRRRYQTRERRIGGQTRSFQFTEYAGHEIWGATARMLMDFAALVEERGPSATND